MADEIEPPTEDEIRADEREEVLEEVAHEQEEQRQWERLSSLEVKLMNLETKLDSLTTTAPEVASETAEATALEPVEEVEAAPEKLEQAPAPRSRFRIL